MRRGLLVLLVTAMGMSLSLTPAMSAEDRPTVDIVGGQTAPIQSAPWQVGLLYASDSSDYTAQFCGGSLINPLYVVTAAHCVVEDNGEVATPGSLAILSGTASLAGRGSRSGVSDVVVYPDYSPANGVHDIALLRLSAPVALDGVTRAAIAIPSGLDPATWPAAGTPAYITGWGETGGGTPDELYAAWVDVLTGPSAAHCGDYGGEYDPATMLCAGRPSGGVDTCQGDSGGPLAVQVGGVWRLAGITSWGSDCAQAGLPGIYTRVTTYLPWLQQAQVFADRVDFGAVAPGQTSQVSYTFGNSGAVTLAVRGETLGGAHADQFSVQSSSCTGASLEPSASCGIVVRFAPTRLGEASATLQIDSSAGPYVVALRGAATSSAAPARPSRLTATAKAWRVKAKWSAVAGASQYRVELTYRRLNGRRVQVEQVVTSPQHAFKIWAWWPSTVRVCVSAVNGAGASSERCVKKRVRLS